jgi:hypothetical protein
VQSWPSPRSPCQKSQNFNYFRRLNNSTDQGIFVIAATNRPDQIDSAVPSRFGDKIEIPSPDQITRAALLKLFLGPLRFNGDRERAICFLAWPPTAKADAICESWSPKPSWSPSNARTLRRSSRCSKRISLKEALEGRILEYASKVNRQQRTINSRLPGTAPVPQSDRDLS